MARTAITPQDLSAHGGGVDDLTWTSADATNDMEIAANNGKMILLVKNDDAGSHECTVVSVADEFGRSGDVTITAGASDICAYGPFPKHLFNQTDGSLHIDFGAGEDASVSVAVLNLLGV